MYIIYKHTNNSNGKSYIGLSSRSIEERFQEHIYEAKNKDSNFLFHKAIRKYGQDNFFSEILEDNIDSLEIANKREEFWIKTLNTHYESGFGYNMTKGGDTLYVTTKGKTYDEIYDNPEYVEEKKRKMSKSQLGKFVSDETKQKMKENHWSKKIKNDWTKEKLGGKKLSEQHKINISIGTKNAINEMSEDERKKVYKHNVGKSNPNYGNKLSDESKKKISENNSVKIECPHCGKFCNKGMSKRSKRWHFDNCKEKK